MRTLIPVFHYEGFVYDGVSQMDGKVVDLECKSDNLDKDRA